MDEQPGAPNQRTFSLNSAEAYEVLCPREDRPWILNGALPREPRTWDQAVIVDPSTSSGRAGAKRRPLR